jgi:hypothetical protein
LLAPQDLRFHVADHSAFALGLLSCWCLARAATPTQRHVAAAAALCALGIACKQITVFLLPAHVLFLALGNDRAAMVHYIAWAAAFGLAALALFSALFGMQNLWLNLVTIPSRLPWGEFELNPRMRWELFAQVLVPTTALFILWRNGRWPGRDQESGRFFQLTVLAAATMLPVGLAALFKIGGALNSLHSWAYLLPGAVLAWLARGREPDPQRGLQVAAVTLIAVAIRSSELRSLPREVFTQHLDAADRVFARLPRGLWFPQNPIVGFYGEGKIWHSEDGVLTRNLAGYSIRERTFRRHLPPDLTGVVVPVNGDSTAILSLLPEYSQVVKLPYWTVHVRSPANPTSP